VTDAPAVEEADPAATAAAMDAGESILIDVREGFEWRAGHARGARHIPMTEIPGRMSELPRQQPIHFICATGNRSGRVAEYLTANGFARPINVAGGMVAWQRAGLPVDRGD
jgi:rhodanese-related sulfurtransferase